MRVEVLSGVERRRRWSRDDKARIVEETLSPGAKVSEVARRHGISASLVFTWRRQSRASREAAPAVQRFAAVQIAATPTEAVQSTKGEQSRAEAGIRSGLIEIRLGGGRWVRVDAGVDAAALARVLDVLERR